MSSRDFHFHDGESGSALAVQIIRKRGETKLSNIKKDGTLVLHCSHQMGNLNQGVMKYFADILKLNPEDVSVVAGRNRSEKLISFINIQPEVIQEKIVNLISGK